MFTDPQRAAAAQPLPARRLLGWPELTSLCIALLTLLLLAAGSIWLTERTGDAMAMAMRLQRQRLAGQHLLIEVQEAETGQRGYLLTGRDQYLAPYQSSLEDVPALLTALDPGSAGPERGEAHELRAAVDAKLAELAQTVAYLRAGDRGAALSLVQTDQGEHLMATIRALTASIGRDQDTALQQQAELVQSRRRLMIALESTGLAVVLLMAAIIALGMRSYLAALQVSGQALTKSNAELADANHGLDEEVRSRTADLQAANDEIQRFAYIVSHDLRAPLVNIVGFTSELEQAAARLRQHVADHDAPADVREAAESDIPEALGFIKTSTSKMDRLINAILRLSREGRRVLSPERLDMAVLCQDIAATLRHQALAKGAEVEVGEMPNLVGDRVAIEQVFTNVIDNALKYTPTL